ncbi:MAG: hypothetical protein HWE27_07500, partial [Gammaproteobacteria bacterium]|nr:hypothetical protein [Gammaproteobacteria bacterium]
MNIRLGRTFFMLTVSALLFACSENTPQEAKADEQASSNNSSGNSESPIALISRPMDRHFDRLQDQFQNNLIDQSKTPLDLWSPYEVSRGAQLSLRSGLDVNASEDELLSAYFGSSDYDVKDLNLSPDGRTLLFAAHGPVGHPTDYSWNIYTLNYDTQLIKRVISDDNVANAGQDTSPVLTMAGNIIFSSDRDAGNPNNPRPNEEFLGDPRCEKVDPIENPSLLHSMSQNGDSIIQLTYGRTNHDIKPTLLTDGRVAFIRWERSTQVVEQCLSYFGLGKQTNSGELLGAKAFSIAQPEEWEEPEFCAYAKLTQQGAVTVTNHYKLLTISADGAQMEQLYNTVTMEPSEESFLAVDRIVQAENGNLYAVLKHQYNEVLGGALVELQPQQGPAGGSVFSELSPVLLSNNDVNLYPGQTSPGGWYSAASPYRDSTGRTLVGWSQCT